MQAIWLETGLPTQTDKRKGGDLMGDTLEVFGKEYTNVAGFKATDNNNTIKTYVRPQGTISINQNGIHNVTNYATASVSVSSQAVSLQAKTASPTESSQTIELLLKRLVLHMWVLRLLGEASMML